MTLLFEKRELIDFQDRDSGTMFADLDFRRCYFESCSISITRSPSKRTTVRNVNLTTCEQRGCQVNNAIVENVLVDGLKTNGLLQTWGAVFKHLTLRGKLGRIMLSPAIAPGVATPAEQRAFDDANREYYSKVDWALDIREGEFEELDIRGIPAPLIRRDASTQAVVTRDKAMSGTWRQLDLSKTYWATSLQFLLDFGYQDMVLVAPKRNRRYAQLLDGLKVLRDAGVAELD
jgi:hypothetical protein